MTTSTVLLIAALVGVVLWLGWRIMLGCMILWAVLMTKDDTAWTNNDNEK